MTNNTTTTGPTWEWSGGFEEGEEELINGADNSIYDYNGDKSFEIMDFQSNITVSYSTGDSTTTNTFSPDYETYELVVDSNLPPNLILTSSISGSNLQIDISGNLGFLKDYAPPFFLPSNFTFDQYDSPHGFYEQGYDLIKAGGNYSYIVNQPSSYTINLNLTVNLYETDMNEENVKSTTKKFTITVGRNYSAMRNQFINGYLEEQISRGDVEYYTYQNEKFYDGESYLKHLSKNLQKTSIIGVSLQSVNGSLSSIVNSNDVVDVGTYFYSDNFNADVYSSGVLQNKDLINESIILNLKNNIGDINIGDTINTDDGLIFLVTNVFSVSTSEPSFSLYF